MRVWVLNGPNLGRLGRRQPEIYGTTTHAELADLCGQWGAALGLEVEVRQTNHEGGFDRLNTAADEAVPVVRNAAAWSHHSDALYDACARARGAAGGGAPLRAPAASEEFRHTSVVTPHATTVIAGHGVDGYRQALDSPAGG